MSVVYADFGREVKPPISPKQASAEIKQFTQRLATCSICGGGTHRASQCPQRPRSDESKRS